MEELIIKRGDRVLITSDCQTSGWSGIVTKINNEPTRKSVSVLFDSKTPSGVNIQTYNINNVKLINSLDTTSNVEMIDGYYIVKCKGAYSSTYNYKCLDKDIKIGDKVVVEGDNNIQTIVGVYNKETAQFKNPTKYVVCVIDYSKLIEIREKEAKQAEIKRKLDSRIKQIQQQIDYKSYADKYPDIAEMLKELDELKETH